ncbi:hypothetical protein ABZ646_39025 [Streptomyces sp. NPDC007162]|uniref:hypothetical protein n=1 Tax=Streptomyces sp. NPDC007162 TaxID=3156917 RepID=UPI0033FB9EF3
MAAPELARGMGTFFKDCERPESRWSKCPHEYTIRYRNAAGRQTEESGFARQDRAIERLTEIYNEKKAASARSQSKAERIQKYGTMRFERVAEKKRASHPSRSSDLVVDLHIECGQEDLQVERHNRILEGLVRSAGRKS